MLHGLNARYGASDSTTILLENPVGKNILNVDSLTKVVNTILNYLILYKFLFKKDFKIKL